MTTAAVSWQKTYGLEIEWVWQIFFQNNNFLKHIWEIIFISVTIRYTFCMLSLMKQFSLKSRALYFNIYFTPFYHIFHSLWDIYIFTFSFLPNVCSRFNQDLSLAWNSIFDEAMLQRILLLSSDNINDYVELEKKITHMWRRWSTPQKFPFGIYWWTWKITIY